MVIKMTKSLPNFTWYQQCIVFQLEIDIYRDKIKKMTLSEKLKVLTCTCRY